MYIQPEHTSKHPIYNPHGMIGTQQIVDLHWQETMAPQQCRNFLCWLLFVRLIKGI